MDGDTYTWDVRNRLASLTGPGLSASFQYDALGRRMKKTFNGQPTEFLSDGVNPLQEQAVPGGNWTALTMTGLGVDEILARGDASGVYYYLPDGLGSTVALTDGTGAVHTEYTYTPFGETTRTGTVGTNPFQFTARENDNTGLYYYRARYYHPVLQRFISEDPIGFRGGDVNLYGYVLNDPMNLLDPSGLDIAVIENGGTTDNFIGHTAIAITGQGVYSFGNNTPLGSSLVAYLLREAPRRDTSVYTDPLDHTTTFTYDTGDLVAVTDPEGNKTTRFIDSVGRVLSLTTPQGQTTRYEYDVLDRLIKITDPLNGMTQFVYDANSNLLSLTDARTKPTSYQHDNRDRVITRTDPLGRSEHYQYDGNNNLTQVIDRKTQPTIHEYDELNRRKLTTYADNSTTAYDYDEGNRMTNVNDSLDGSLACGHDGLNRLTLEGSPRGTVNYSYDAAGNRKTLSATGQDPAAYDYDEAEQLTSVSLYGLLAHYGYDDAGRRTSLTLPNGVKVEYGYDKASQLTGLSYKLGSSVLGDLTYTYDKNGQRVKVGGSFARTTLPDPVSSATYDDANRPLTFDGFSVAHDYNGNLTSLDGDTFTWNVRDQLVGIVGTGLSASFGYDGLGRRSKKTVNGQTIEYLSDGTNPLQEQAVAGGPWTALMMTGPGLDEFIARGDSSGVYYYLPDGLGSTVALTDGAGTVHTEYTYAPFGETTRTGTVATNPFQFTGRENDGTGLYHYRARYYHPILQRFMSEDPIEFLGGDVNLYAYVGNDPVNLIDPSGMQRLVWKLAPGLLAPECSKSDPLPPTAGLGERVVNLCGEVLRTLQCDPGLDLFPVLGIAKIEKAFERQLAKEGVRSLEKSLRSIGKNLAEHMQKLEEIKAAGGHTSSVEREIRTFHEQIEAIKRILGRQK